jgi:hypothetical protein
MVPLSLVGSKLGFAADFVKKLFVHEAAISPDMVKCFSAKKKPGPPIGVPAIRLYAHLVMGGNA